MLVLQFDIAVRKISMRVYLEFLALGFCGAHNESNIYVHDASSEINVVKESTHWKKARRKAGTVVDPCGLGRTCRRSQSL